MKPLRRTIFVYAGALAAGLVLAPLRALAAWNKEAFGAKTAADALKGPGVAGSADSKDIAIEAPRIA